MNWASSAYSYWFWAVFALVIFLIWARRRREALIEKFAEKQQLPELLSSVDFRRRALKNILLVFAFTFTVIALMRPQWGFQWQEVKRRGLDILIAIDTSKSMLAPDVKPNRLGRAKLAVKDLVKRLRGDRIGLIAFSGTAYLQCPLTVDYDGLLLALNDLDTAIIPRGGTSISNAVEEALKHLKGDDKKYKVLVIITDGEDHEGDIVSAAQNAGDENIKVFCIGIGTPEGELIRVTDESGNKTFLKDGQGNIIKSSLNEDVLKRISLITGGTYVRSSGARFGLELLYDEKLSKMEKREIDGQMSKRYNERFQIPLAVAFVLLLSGTLMEDRKR